jgi:hypothetical protein
MAGYERVVVAGAQPGTVCLPYAQMFLRKTPVAPSIGAGLYGLMLSLKPECEVRRTGFSSSPGRKVSAVRVRSKAYIKGYA